MIEPTAKLGNNTWVYWQRERGQGIPVMLTLYKGGWMSREKVGEVSKYQVLAYLRHHPSHKYSTSLNRIGHWIDAYVVGDIYEFLTHSLEE